MHKTSSALTEAAGRASAFGGINVIFAGNFAQLPPVGDVRLYKEMDLSSASTSSSNRAQSKVFGKLLWLSVDTVVILPKTMKQAGPGNARFVLRFND